jgi:hypothetical protein
MTERSKETRNNAQMIAYFLQDGSLFPLKLCDTAQAGVGAFAAQSFKPGQQGLLMACLAGKDQIEEIPSEVCWCLADPMAEDKTYSYRIGLRLLDGRD